MCLAHHLGSEVERAYRRSELLAKRRELLTAWQTIAGASGLIGTEESRLSSACEACESAACAVESRSPLRKATVSALMRSSPTAMPRKSTSGALALSVEPRRVRHECNHLSDRESKDLCLPLAGTLCYRRRGWIVAGQDPSARQAVDCAPAGGRGRASHAGACAA